MAMEVRSVASFFDNLIAGDDSPDGDAHTGETIVLAKVG